MDYRGSALVGNMQENGKMEKRNSQSILKGSGLL